MRRGLVVGAALALLTGVACGGSSSGRPGSSPALTVTPASPLERALLTRTQLRQVPTLATAAVTPLRDLAVLDEADPRGPCGARLPRLSLADAVGVAIAADTIRGGVHAVVRLRPGVAKQFLDARQADTAPGCSAYTVRSPQGTRQTVQLVRVVPLHREFEQAIAVILAVTVDDSVRAATLIEVRSGDVLARTVLYANQPPAHAAVRGIAAVMGQNLSDFEE